jgi:hypothetical protein
MRHLISEESWLLAPRAIAYFCSALPDAKTSGAANEKSSPDYPLKMREAVRRGAINFLNRDIKYLWPAAVLPNGGFRWDLLVVANESPVNSAQAGAATANSGAASEGQPESRFDDQFWTANVNPSDRYVQSPPKTTRFRISPLDNTYDNLTIAGDWTACGLNVGCVEAAVMSGRLAAHALAKSPALEDIVGYDHP